MVASRGPCRWIPALMAALFGNGAARAQSPAVQPAQAQWSGVERVIAFADVHGAYAELLPLLRESGVIDAQDHWAAGRAHAVSLGDLLDRGDESRKVMDLLMRLQGEAQSAGGQLHVLLGNHEALNLLGDLRYATPRDLASYADLGPAAARDAQPDPKLAPGYAGQRAAFAPDGRYGRWLLALPVAITINDTLFMHAGPSNVVRGMTLQELNVRYRTALTDYLGLAERLAQAKLLQAGDDYAERPRLARERLAAMTAANGNVSDAALAQAVQRFQSADANALLSDNGPNWYRGPALCREASENDVLAPLLQQFGVARLVVGHTPTHDLRVVTRFDGRVVKLDTGMNRAVYKGHPAALSIQPSGITVRYAGQAEVAAPAAEPLYVAPDEVDDASVLAALRDGEVSVTGTRAPNEMDATVSLAGRRIPAVFRVRSAGDARKEVAAYRLDRLMGLGLVPVSVEREVQGRRGVLQARPAKWVTQTEVQQKSLRFTGWCGLDAQFQLMYAFDVLAGNEGRTPDSMLFDATAWYLYATSFERAFGAAGGLPGYLQARPPTPGAEFRQRAAALDEAGLTTALGDLLDARARRAILARRDALRALPAVAAGAAAPRR